MKNNGIINMHKPLSVTSHAVVSAVRRTLSEKKVGHCGTLDPLATGVLPIMVGSAVKASEYLTDHDKTYVAKIQLGIETDTEDITGTVLKTFEGTLPDFAEVEKAAKAFEGAIFQTPPMYSALKVNGKKLVDLARQGIETERKPRQITVYSISAENRSDGIYLNVCCSKGTYIRTLIADIGKKLGCGAVMASLCRTAVGKYENGVLNSIFNLQNAITPQELEEIFKANGDLPLFDIGEIDGKRPFIRTEEVFENLPVVKLPPFFERLFSNGAEIYISKLKELHNAEIRVGDKFRIYGADGFFALASAELYGTELALKQIKLFNTPCNQ